MNRILAEAVGLVLALAIGFGLGWHNKGVSVTATEVVASKAEAKAVVTDYTAQGAQQHAQQTVEQGKSLDLGAEQLAVHTTVTDLKQEIHRANFQPAAVPPAVCADRDDPVGSAEFMRLYNAAARGHATAAGSTTAH